MAQAEVAWTTPEQARIVRWIDPPVAPREADPKKPVELDGSDLLMVPVEPGDRLRISGAEAAVGLASGAAEEPDVVTWFPDAPLEGAFRRVDVPAWTASRLIAVRTKSARKGSVRVEIAAPPSDGLAWHRFDRALYDALRWGGPEPAPPLEGRPAHRWIQSARRALEGVPGPARAAWLMARWLEESYRERPIVMPYFAARPLSFDAPAGTALSADVEGNAWRTVQAGQRLVIRSDRIDVMRLGLDARAVGPTTVVVRDGDTVARVASWVVPSRAAGAVARLDPEWIRVVPAVSSREIVLEVVEGRVAIAAIGYRHKTDVFDAASLVRDRGRRLQDASTGGGVLDALSAVALRPSASNHAALVAALGARGVPPMLSGLGYAEASRLASDPTSAEVLAWKGFADLAADGAGATLPLVRRVLEHLDDVSTEAKGPREELAWAAAPVPELEDETESIRALWSALYVARDGARPLGAFRAERYAARHPELGRPAHRARHAWVREGPWRAASFAPGTPVVGNVVQPVDEPGSPTCKLEGPEGQRWTLLADPTTAVDVARVDGTHARVLFRSASNEPERESEIVADGVPIAVHAGAGLVSVAAVEPGRRVFQHEVDAPPAMALLPREGSAPCRTLREIERWARVEKSVGFDLPGEGRATVARVLVAGAEARSEGRPASLAIAAGGAKREAWVRGAATGEIEIPVPAEVTSLHVEVSTTLRVRASIRLHPAAPPAARIVAARASEGLSVEGLLARVREKTRELVRATSEPAVVSIRRSRADVLQALGYSRFAELDRRAGLIPSLPLDAESDEGLEASPEDGPPRVRSLALPRGSPRVTVLGYVGRIPPLALPPDRAALFAARRALLTGDAEGAVGVLLPHAAGSTAADRLLLAFAAERAQKTALARDGFLAVGRELRAGAAIAHASSLTADLALAQGSLEQTAQAYALAEEATGAGDPAGSAFARLSGTMRWLTPAQVEGAAGSALVELRARGPGSGAPKTEPSLAVRVRRALLDAPEEAMLLSEHEQLMVRLRRSTKGELVIAQRCYAIDGGPEDCQAPYRLDGAPVRCAGTSAPTQTPGSSWRTTTCSIPVPAGEHRIESALAPGREVIAWMEVRESAAGSLLESRVVSPWVEIDAARPLEILCAGPTVARIQARADQGAARQLSVRLGDTAPRRWELDGAEDPGARRALGTGEVGLGIPLESRLAVAAPGPQLLRIASSAGRALVRVDFATAVALPVPREEAPVPGLPSGSRLAAGAEARPAAIAIGEDPDPGPLTVGATVMFVDADIVQADKVTLTQATNHSVKPYLELQGRLRRELVARRAWAGATAIARVRSGPASYGGQASFDGSPAGFVPGWEVDAKAMAQPFDAPATGGTPASQGTALGLGLRAQVLWALRLLPDAVLVPWLQHNSTAIDDRVRVLNEADGDIYNLYDASHPHYETAGIRLNLRPFVDTQVKFGGSIRSTPRVDGIDRYDVRVDGDSLPGQGWFPWLGLSFLFSYRPVTPDRPEAFLRTIINPRLTFFRWLGRGQRVTAGLEANVVLDRPEISPGPPLLSGFAFIGYDFTGGRGVRDFPPRDTMFRDRMEEGSGRIERDKSGLMPAWGESP
jgi:hypothetical protein